MKTTFNFFKTIVFSVALIALQLIAGIYPASAQKMSVKNIVLVHGAFADGSGWKAVYDILTKKGYHVSIVQNPLTSLQNDVDATNSVINAQDSPVILVGHSWGGAVISQAGVNPKVTALVFVAAFVPDEGETAGKWIGAAPAAPEAGFSRPDQFGFVYYDPAKFHGGFAADLSQAQADFMRASQVPIIAKCFDTPLEAAAWKKKPSYGIVATEDKSLAPETERTMYQRARAKITELKGSHVIFISHPQEVANVIIAAASGK